MPFKLCSFVLLTSFCIVLCDAQQPQHWMTDDFGTVEIEVDRNGAGMHSFCRSLHDPSSLDSLEFAATCLSSDCPNSRIIMLQCNNLDCSSYRSGCYYEQVMDSSCSGSIIVYKSVLERCSFNRFRIMVDYPSTGGKFSANLTQTAPESLAIYGTSDLKCSADHHWVAPVAIAGLILSLLII